MRAEGGQHGGFLLRLHGGLVMPFVKIPKGHFIMGDRYGEADENPQHRVQLTENFYMSAFPVTRGQYRGSNLKSDSWLPAVALDWESCRSYCEILAKPNGLESFNYRLPTEAEWEYACRAGSETDYCNGDGEAALEAVGWSSGSDGIADPQPVGGKQCNAWGLYDMHGNDLP
jgi:formylglycine-generating enzyme required for sulfatase activity